MDFRRWSCSWGLDVWPSSGVQETLFFSSSQQSHWYILIMKMNQSFQEVMEEWILLYPFSQFTSIEWYDVKMEFFFHSYIRFGFWILINEDGIKGLQTHPVIRPVTGSEPHVCSCFKSWNTSILSISAVSVFDPTMFWLEAVTMPYCHPFSVTYLTGYWLIKRRCR